jgi:hypothetical protein
MICHWIEESMMNPLTSSPSPNMEEMKEFHPLEVVVAKNPIERRHDL